MLISSGNTFTNTPEVMFYQLSGFLLGQVKKLKKIKTSQRYRGVLIRKTMLEEQVFEDVIPPG